MGEFSTAGLSQGTGFHAEFLPPISVIAGQFDMLGLDIRSFREPLKRSIQKVIAPSFAQNFQVGGRPEAWQPLSAGTIANKEAAGSAYAPEQILMRSGLLFKTMQQLNIWTLTSTSASIVELPDKIAYGEAHQFGLGFNPVREFAVLQEEDMDKIDEIFADWMEERALARLTF
jgi:phage gpG-like protein